MASISSRDIDTKGRGGVGLRVGLYVGVLGLYVGGNLGETGGVCTFKLFLVNNRKFNQSSGINSPVARAQ
jgi:hypothetical protein